VLRRPIASPTAIPPSRPTGRDSKYHAFVRSASIQTGGSISAGWYVGVFSVVFAPAGTAAVPARAAADPAPLVYDGTLTREVDEIARSGAVKKCTITFDRLCARGQGRPCRRRRPYGGGGAPDSLLEGGVTNSDVAQQALVVARAERWEPASVKRRGGGSTSRISCIAMAARRPRDGRAPSPGSRRGEHRWIRCSGGSRRSASRQRSEKR